MARYNRKNRAIVSGILVGLASIYAIAGHFDLDLGQLWQFMAATLVFFLSIVVLAGLALLLIKATARLLGGKREWQPPAADEPGEDQNSSR